MPPQPPQAEGIRLPQRTPIRSAPAFAVLHHPSPTIHFVSAKPTSRMLGGPSAHHPATLRIPPLRSSVSMPDSQASAPRLSASTPDSTPPSHSQASAPASRVAPLRSRVATPSLSTAPSAAKQAWTTSSQPEACSACARAVARCGLHQGGLPVAPRQSSRRRPASPRRAPADPSDRPPGSRLPAPPSSLCHWHNRPSTHRRMPAVRMQNSSALPSAARRRADARQHIDRSSRRPCRE